MRVETAEWLVTNGLGGYASGTLSGPPTRRYHGALIAALPAPLGRTMMLNALRECGARFVGFALEDGLPVWTYDIDGARVEKRVFMVHLQNTTCLTYRLVDGDAVRLQLEPAMALRAHDAPVSEPLDGPYELDAVGDRYALVPGHDVPALRLLPIGADRAFIVRASREDDVGYAMEAARGYPSRGPLWIPGRFTFTLGPDTPAALLASVEPWDTIAALDPLELLDAERQRRARLIVNADVPAAGIAAELVLAADQFVITPVGRVEDETRARAAGDEARTVIAGYHWFTDWGRDTMISLEGLTLCTGRAREAGYILRTFAHYVRDGLIPNMFPEGAHEGLYHTADATLWFFHALDRYVRATGDRATLRELLPTLKAIVDHHQRGTRFGIGVDPADGLLRQGAEGYQLTWMDAKVDGWVVTPRRGKAVEINALWFNALALTAAWVREEGGAPAEFEDAAARAAESFNRRFWYADGGYLYDVVDGEGGGDDTACRPNQIFAFSLDHPVLARERWAPVFDTVRDRLQTPVGLRSLDPRHPDYKATYSGDLRSRDAAYHQGTVWAWLAGPFVDAWLRVRPDERADAHRWVDGVATHLGDAGIGTLSEIFDGDPPFTPRGCIAQAWSVAEVLRAWVGSREPGIGDREPGTGDRVVTNVAAQS
jgi:predicted glycogen debranching enzyme